MDDHESPLKWKSGVPIEVLPFAYKPVYNKLLKLGAKKVTLRMGSPSKAGPSISDNGNFLIDADFGLIADPEGLEQKLKRIPGIVETGLFVDVANCAYFGMSDG